MHVHHTSPADPSSRAQQSSAARSPTFSLSAADSTAATTPPAAGTTATTPANSASPFMSMASNLQSILLGASQPPGGTASSRPGQAANAYGLAGSLLG